jgi:hypothetical protein
MAGATGRPSLASPAQESVLSGPSLAEERTLPLAPRSRRANGMISATAPDATWPSLTNSHRSIAATAIAGNPAIQSRPASPEYFSRNCQRRCFWPGKDQGRNNGLLNFRGVLPTGSKRHRRVRLPTATSATTARALDLPADRAARPAWRSATRSTTAVADDLSRRCRPVTLSTRQKRKDDERARRLWTGPPVLGRGDPARPRSRGVYAEPARGRFAGGVTWPPSRPLGRT